MYAPPTRFPHPGRHIFRTASHKKRRTMPHNHHFINGYTHFKVLQAKQLLHTFANDKSMFHSGCTRNIPESVSFTPRGGKSALRFNCYVSCSKREISCSLKVMVSPLLFSARPPQNPCTAHTKNTPTRIAKHREQTLQNTTLPLMFLPSFLPLL